MKKIVVLFVLFCAPLCLFAQDLTIGKTQDQIRAMVRATPTFKLGAGENSDTLSFQAGMQTIFYYKDRLCYRSKSVFPAIFKDMVIKKMTEDGYMKIGDDVWTDAKKRVIIKLSEDKTNNRFISEATRADDAVSKD